MPEIQENSSVKNKDVDVLIITGMSGAGKTLVASVLEDAGYFCVDNLPPSLFLKFMEGLVLAEGKINRIALVVDTRGVAFFSLLDEALTQLKQLVNCRLVFLDCSDEVLLRRYKATRRRHPLNDGQKSVIQSIKEERRLLSGLRGKADIIIDTSKTSVKQLTALLNESFAEGAQEGMLVSVISFGYKYGLPTDADIVIDMRFLENPFYDPQMCFLSGSDKKVRDFVLGQEASKRFLRRYLSLMTYLLPLYIKEGKHYLTIAVGCTGGRHRSVATADAISKQLKRMGYHVRLEHRDMERAEFED